MSELLKALKQVRIKAKQFADDDTNNSMLLTIGVPKRRYVVNVSKNVQDFGDERYITQARSARVD